MNKTEFDISSCLSAPELSADEKNILITLLRVYERKLSNNKTRLEYYRNKVKVKNIGIAVEDKYEDLDPKVDWAAKAVDMLAERSMFDGFAVSGEENEELNAIMLNNDFALTYEMALTSELIYSCGFWTVTKGDKYPIIRYFNAENAAAIWNWDKRRIQAGFVVTDYSYDTNGDTNPCHVVLHTDDKVVNLHRNDDNEWHAKSTPHFLGRPYMEAMSYKPTDDRPFGKSVISKSVMSIIDEVKRELLRTSLHSELYTSPAKYVLGTAKLTKEQAESIKSMFRMNEVFVNEKDSDGDKPEVGQLPAASMEPHLSNIRRLTMQMAAETSIPLNSMGLQSEANPTSAEALYAGLDELCVKAEKLNETNGRALRNLAKIALAAYRGKTFDEINNNTDLRIDVCWKNPKHPTLSSQADAMVKLASVIPWIVETDVFYERLDFKDAERQRIKVEKRRIEAQQRVNAYVQPIEVTDIKKEKEKEEKVNVNAAAE